MSVATNMPDDTGKQGKMLSASQFESLCEVVREMPHLTRMVCIEVDPAGNTYEEVHVAMCLRCRLAAILGLPGDRQ